MWPAEDAPCILRGKAAATIARRAVDRREYELGILLPDPPSLVHKIKTDDPVGIEAYWHGQLAAKRKDGTGTRWIVRNILWRDAWQRSASQSSAFRKRSMPP
jgi:hypothetical protein